MTVKQQLHEMIEKIEDERLLEKFYTLLSSIHLKQTGKLYDSLSDEQKKELNLSYEESFDDENLLNHDDVKAEFSEWL